MDQNLVSPTVYLASIVLFRTGNMMFPITLTSLFNLSMSKTRR